jgi:hypothetical protein
VDEFMPHEIASCLRVGSVLAGAEHDMISDRECRRIEGVRCLRGIRVSVDAYM